jgi:hypothetical protein
MPSTAALSPGAAAKSSIFRRAEAPLWSSPVEPIGECVLPIAGRALHFTAGIMPATTGFRWVG